MRLFEKVIKSEKDTAPISSYSNLVLKDIENLEIRINKLKELMTTLSKTRKKNQAREREIISEHFFQVLKYISDCYLEYLSDLEYLHDLYSLLKTKPELELSQKVQQKVDLAFNSKVKIRKEFENIYINFKSLAKNFDNIPMKAILSKMREVFGFENNQKQSPSRIRKYYDSTTMTFRLLN